MRINVHKFINAINLMFSGITHGLLLLAIFSMHTLRVKLHDKDHNKQAAKRGEIFVA